MRRFSITFLLISLLVLSTDEASSDDQSSADLLVKAALERLDHKVIYDPGYFSLKYPLGDVPADRGVCTDVIIRSYRALGIDLQQLVHEDMKRNFTKYPKIWGLSKPDWNIDHRRVPNLEKFFERKGHKLGISENAADYLPGEIVTWNIGGKRLIPHIGIVVDRKSDDKKRHLIVHNIGAGPQCEDILFGFPITGHYSYFPSRE